MSDSTAEARAPAVAEAKQRLDAHTREIVAWHFSEETGTPFWLDYAERVGLDPRAEVRGFDDLIRLFDHFDADHNLRREPHERFVPRAYAGRPFAIFETGGTTGMPKQRITWDDYKRDYEAFSETLDDDSFPPGGPWLMVGPTGPRRLRLAIEHLANHRGSPCYFVDLDPRWVKKLLAANDTTQAKAYMEHVVDQAMTIMRNRPVRALFTTPRLLEALAERTSLPLMGIRGVFAGGTEMDQQYTRFLVEEVLENQIQLVPTYGNTLMGLAAHRPGLPEQGYSITYHAPQPRAVLRVVNPEQTDELVDYGEWGRVELTTLTHEFFMPRFLERDEALRCEPCARFPWDGVGEVRPFRSGQQQVVEGVY